MIFHNRIRGKFPLLLLFLSVFCSTVTAGFSQIRTPDSAFVKESIEAAVQAYRQSVGVHAHLYSGQAYVDYRRLHREGHQFFSTDNFSSGTIIYEGAFYPYVPVLYDLVQDEVVIKTKNSTLKQKLVGEKINSFQVHGYSFVRFHRDSLAPAMPSGFYNVLYSNDIKLLAKRKKKIVEEPDGRILKQIFLPANSYYVYKDKQYFQVKGKRAMYQVLKDRKKELKKFARANKLNFKERKDEAFLALIRHYDSLSE